MYVYLTLERQNWKDILTRASELREQINIQLWINAVLETTIYSSTMAGLYKPALIELSPDRFLPGQIIERAINQSGSVQRQVFKEGHSGLRIASKFYLIV